MSGVSGVAGVDDEFDVRTLPKNFVKDKEGLYDDVP